MLEQVKAEFPHARFVEQTAKHMCFVHLPHWPGPLAVYGPTAAFPSWRCDVYDNHRLLQGDSEESLAAAHAALIEAAREYFAQQTVLKMEVLCSNK